MIHSESESVSLAAEERDGEEEFPSSIQARTRHDILVAEGIEMKEHEIAESGEKSQEDKSPSSPSVTSLSSPSSNFPDSQSSAILQGYGRDSFASSFLSPNPSEQSKRSLDSLSSFNVPPSSILKFSSTSTSNSQKAIRDALTSGSASLADFSSFLSSQSSSFLSSPPAPTSNLESLSSDNPPELSVQEKEEGGERGSEDSSRMTSNASGMSDDRDGSDEQFKLEEKPLSIQTSSSSSQEGGRDENFPTQQMVLYQSPFRPPNVRGPQVFSRSPLHRHWANKHAWFATRPPRPSLLRPFFPPRVYPPRTSPSPSSLHPPSSTIHGKYIPSAHRTNKNYMRPVDYVRNRLHPKRRTNTMFSSSSSQFQRRPYSLFSSLFHPHSPLFSPSTTSSLLMPNHPNQMQPTLNSPFPSMMYPMNVRNWFFNNPFFGGTRRPVQQSMSNMNPSLLAFPFPTITNRLPPSSSKFNVGPNQDPRKYKRVGNNHNRGTGGIKTAASTTSSTYTIANEYEGENGREKIAQTGYRRRHSTRNYGNRQEGEVRGKSQRGKKKRRTNTSKKKIGSQVSHLVNDTPSKTKDDGRDTLETRTVSTNTWKGIDVSERLTKQHNRKEKLNRRENDVPEMEGKEKDMLEEEQIDDVEVAHVRIVRSYPSIEIGERSYRGMKKVHFNDSRSSSRGPIIVPVTSYISFMASADKTSPSKPNLSPPPPPPHYPTSPPSHSPSSHSLPHPHSVPKQMRSPDVTLTAEPTFQLFDGSQVTALDKHDIHHHYYYNDRSDHSEEDEYGNKHKKGEVNQKKEKDYEKEMNDKLIEEMEKKRKQEMKEKKFMDGEF